MSVVAFDSLEYAHQLEAAGMPWSQAEVVAKGLTSMFIHNFEGLPRFTGYSLVTKDYLDTRFAESEARMYTLLGQLEAKMDGRFAAVDAKMDGRFAAVDTRFARLEITGGIILVAVAIPLMQSFWALLS